MKCTGGRWGHFLVCLQVFRPSPVISIVLLLKECMDLVMNDPHFSQEENSSVRRTLWGFALKLFSGVLIATCVLVGAAFILAAFGRYLDSVEIFGRLLPARKEIIHHDAFFKLLTGWGFLAISLALLVGQLAWGRRKR